MNVLALCPPAWMHRNGDGTEQKLIIENNDQVKNNFKKISYERITNWEKIN